jgi:hypothetical protein
LGRVQRRGTHVNTPEIGSRGEEIVFGGIWGIHADLRRDLKWGNLVLMVFLVLGRDPRELIEEGGQLVLLFVLLGEFWRNSLGCWNGVKGLLKGNGEERAV